MICESEIAALFSEDLCYLIRLRRLNTAHFFTTPELVDAALLSRRFCRLATSVKQVELDGGVEARRRGCGGGPFR